MNISIGEVRLGARIEEEIIQFCGMRYVVPPHSPGAPTILAINVGGAIVPTAVSLYLLVKHRFFLSGLIEMCVVAAISRMFAYPVRGVGVAAPLMIAPTAAAATSVMPLRNQAPALTYLGDSLGTLIGADFAEPR